MTFDRLGVNVAFLSGVHQLDISHNKLTELPPGLQFLKKLKKLNLSHNLLSTLTDELLALTSLVQNEPLLLLLNKITGGIECIAQQAYNITIRTSKAIA